MSIKMSQITPRFVCTGIYLPTLAGMKHSSFAYTPMASSGLSLTALLLILSRVILQTHVDTLSASVAFNTFPNLRLIKLWHTPSTNHALKADMFFVGIAPLLLLCISTSGCASLGRIFLDSHYDLILGSLEVLGYKNLPFLLDILARVQPTPRTCSPSL